MPRHRSTHTRGAWAPTPLVFATLLSALGMAPPAAAVDLSGEYIATVPIPCRLTLVQTGTSSQTTGSCDFNGTPTPYSGSGTVDPATGAFSGPFDLGGVCSGVISGTGDGEVLIGTSTGPCYSGPISATKCGNGVIDPLENCEDGNQADGDCCSARCRLDAAGTACTGDRNECTDDVCNATGTCTQVPVPRPCDYGNACTVGDVCAGGACEPGAQEPAGVTCNDEFDPCTADVCDAAGACTHVPVPRAECRRAVPCHSTCTQQLKACRRTCPASGEARRDCRAACAARTTCAAPGAPIRTLAYVVTECRQDARGYSARQTLRVQRGTCDPVTVAGTETPAPIPDPDWRDPGWGCEVFGKMRAGYRSVFDGVFTRLGVSPDGSVVVFEVMNDFSVRPDPFPLPLEEGIYRVGADGRGLRRIGPPSRASSFGYVYVSDNLVLRWNSLDVLYRFSPDNRTIVFTDLGPGPAGEDAIQIATLDIATGRQTHVTHLSFVHNPREHVAFTTAPRFVDRDTILFFTYGAIDGKSGWFKIHTDGTGLEAATSPVAIPGSQVRPTFEIAGGGTNIVGMGLGEFVELFLLDGRKLLQLTNFGHGDTGLGGKLLDRRAQRGYFTASADPLGENPSQNCQLFSIDTLGRGLRQLTHFHEVDRSEGGCGYPPIADPDRPGCAIGPIFQDRVTRTIVFHSACDPFGTGTYGGQVFSVRPDGTGLRQLTGMRGLVREADGAVSVELPGPVAYSAPDGGRALY